MKFLPLAISALALALTACGAPDDTRAQDSVFEPAAERAVPRDAAEVKASFAPSATKAAAKLRRSQARTAGRDTHCRRTEAAKQP